MVDDLSENKGSPVPSNSNPKSSTPRWVGLIQEEKLEVEAKVSADTKLVKDQKAARGRREDG